MTTMLGDFHYGCHVIFTRILDTSAKNRKKIIIIKIIDNQNYPQFHFAIIKQIIIDFLYDAPDLNVADDTTSHSKKAGVMKKQNHIHHLPQLSQLRNSL